jgi:hypothetical protein
MNLTYYAAFQYRRKISNTETLRTIDLAPIIGKMLNGLPGKERLYSDLLDYTVCNPSLFFCVSVFRFSSYY